MSLLRPRASRTTTTATTTTTTATSIANNQDHGHNQNANSSSSLTVDNGHIAKPGDLVIIQEHYTTLKPLKLEPGAFVNNRFGRFSHDDILGRPLGRRIVTKKPANTAQGRPIGAGFVHALAPTPELWSQAMDHRTQIVYPHDASLISLLLELRPGSVLVECGTGSGSASVCFARIVAPTGTIYSFDFHKERAQAAIEDFKQLGISNLLNVSGGIDVVKQGFVNVPDHVADAVFLDLPMPYEMGNEINRVLKSDGIVCMFSPCVEQVQKSCNMLRNSGFHSVRTVTAPVKTYETREMKLETPGFDDLAIRQPEEERDQDNDHLHQGDSSISQPPIKRMKTEHGNGTTLTKPNTEKSQKLKSRTAGAERAAIAAMEGEGRHIGRVIRPNIKLHSKPFPSMKGHTSYLTFARKCTDFSPQPDDDDNDDKGGDRVMKDKIANTKTRNLNNSNKRKDNKNSKHIATTSNDTNNNFNGSGKDPNNHNFEKSSECNVS